MGKLLTTKSINAPFLDSISSAIVLIDWKLGNISTIVGYETLDVNRILMNELKSLADRKEILLIDDLFYKLITTKGREIVLTNFEILFDPAYRLDVMKFLEKLNNRVKVVAVWPGTFKDNLLIYSEPQYEDYAKYNLSDYNITLIVERG